MSMYPPHRFLLPVALASFAGSAPLPAGEGHGGDDAFWRDAAALLPSYAGETPAPGPSSEAGQWSGVKKWPHIPVSAALLPNGKLLTYSGQEVKHWPGTATRTRWTVYDPETDTFDTATYHDHEMFCAGLVMRSDGMLQTTGGRYTVRHSSIYDFRTNVWKRADDMFGPRWYNTSVALPDGDVFALSGKGSPTGAEKYDHRADAWRILGGLNWTPGETERNWPQVLLAPDGRLFHFGPTEVMHWVEHEGNGAMTSTALTVPGTVNPVESTFVMYDIGKVLSVGGYKEGIGGRPTDTAFTVDFSSDQPVVEPVEDRMSDGRQFSNAVVLPNGEVLILGGNELGLKFTDSGGLTTVELWNPVTREFRDVAPMSVRRGYHSTGMLLPDGRVFCGGGGYGGRGFEPYNHDDAEFFTPPMLFNPDGTPAERPVLESAPESVSCGSVIEVTGSEGITTFAAIRLSSTTHATNTDQRRISLPFSEVSPGAYQVIAHPNPNVMVPGYWMLFGVYPDGAYSEARMIHVKETGATPDAGLRAEYFDGTGFVNFKFSRIDHEVNFNWGDGSPDTAVLGDDGYAVRWSGQVVPDYSEDYTFHVTANDGVRLWVDGRQLVNRWTTSSGQEDAGTIRLEAGVPVDLVMEFAEAVGEARAELRWSSARTPKQVIPETHLRHEPAAASARVAANRVHELFVDGRLVGIGTAADQTYSVNFAPGSGAVTLALRVCNTGGEPFALGDFLINGERIATDGRWKVSTTVAEGWREPGFDDRGWEDATVVGTGAPAGLGGFPASSAAQRIWAADAGAAEVFLRFTFDPDALRLDPVADRVDPVGVPVTWTPGHAAPEGVELTFSASGLPAGLALDPATGTVSGVPAAAATGAVTLTVAGSDGSADAVTFNWSIREPVDGRLLREWWTEVPGGTVADLLADARFPDSPGGSELVGAEFPVGVSFGDEYGSRLRGILNIEVTGEYVFWLSTDDGGELRLGTGEDPATAQTIASVPGWSGPEEWAKYPEQQSAPVRLQAGGRYYLEILQKDDGGGDHINLAWRRPGESGITVVPSTVLSSYQPNRAPFLNPLVHRRQSAGSVVSLQVTGSDPDGDVLTYGATGLPEGLGIDPATGEITGILTTAGVSTVTVSVSDGRGGTDTAGFSWTVNPPLTVTAGSTGVVDGGAEAAFTAARTGGTDVSYVWNFGDGTPDTPPSGSPDITHTFAAPGRYTVTVTATDANGTVARESFVQNVRGPLGAARPAASSSVVVTRAGDAVWTVNPDNDTVTVLDPATGSRLAEIPAGDGPRTLAEAPDGRLWVVNKEEATVHVIDPSTYLTDTVLPLPPGSDPHGLAFSPVDGTAWLALEGAGELLKLDGRSGTVLGSVAVGATPRHVALPGDGGQVLVSRFISPPVDGEPGAAPDIADGGGEVRVVDPQTLAVGPVVTLAQSRVSDFGGGGRGLPNYLGAVAISPDGTDGWVPSKQDNIHRGVLRDTRDLNHENTVRAVVSRIDLVTGAEDTAGRVDLDDAAVPSAALFGPNGLHLFVALEGNREVAVVDAGDRGELFRIPVGLAPQGLALSPDGTRLFVHNFMGRSVTALDIEPLVDRGLPEVAVLGTWGTVSEEVLDARVLLGKQLFYDAQDDRLARQDYMSCAACHNDGGHDGRTWDLTGFGEGVRNTIDLRGRAGTAHGRLHWSANFDEVQDFEQQIRDLAGGDGLLAGASPHPPLGTPNAGRSSDLDALAAYLASLDSFGRSPHRAEDGSLTPDAVEGRRIFHAASCTDCHGGDEFTDSPRGGLHDVGTLTANSGQRLGGALTRLDTPTLRGLWRGGPYLHDGSAATVAGAVRAHAGVDLDEAQLAQLEAYLLQIDDLEPAPPGMPVVDGDLSDWHPMFSMGTDPDDISGDANHIDLRELWLTESSTEFLFAWRNDTAVVPSWGDTIYLDTDRMRTTGFDMFGALGAEYMIQSGAVFAYTGTGRNWSWAEVAPARVAVNGEAVEMAVPKAAIGGVSSFSLLFYGDNRAFPGGSGVDLFPQNADGSGTGPRALLYTGGVPLPGITVDGDLADWSDGEAGGFDPDDISGADNPIDLRELRLTNEGGRLFLALRNEQDIVPSWGDSLYLDTDSSVATGFVMFGILGADYLVQDGGLFRYSGNGTNWSWSPAGPVEQVIAGPVAEMALNLADLGSPSSFRLLYHGDNAAHPDGSGVDLFPDNADGSSTGDRFVTYQVVGAGVASEESADGMPAGQPPILTGPGTAPDLTMGFTPSGTFSVGWETVPGFTDTLEWSTDLQTWTSHDSVTGDGTAANMTLDPHALGNPPDLFVRVRREER